MSKNVAVDMLGCRGVFLGVILGGGAAVAALAKGRPLAALAFAAGGVVLVLLGRLAFRINRD